MIGTRWLTFFSRSAVPVRRVTTHIHKVPCFNATRFSSRQTNMSVRKCAELIEAGKPLTFAEYAIPDPPEEGLVIKTSFAGICHSDIHMQDDLIVTGGEHDFKFTMDPAYKYPVVMGHEISGVVHSLGTKPPENSPELDVGDQVMVYPWLGCFSPDCGNCSNGESQLCKTWTKGLGVGTPGGYATYVSVPRRDVVIKVPDNIPMETAAMLPCSGLTAYNAATTAQPTIEKLTKLNGKASLLVIGAGGLGMWGIQIARAVLPHTTTIIAADISEEKLQNALKQGADKMLLWNSDDENALMSMTRKAGSGQGIDAVIDFVNTSKTSARAFNSLVKGGALVSVGLFGGVLTISLSALVSQCRKVTGCLVGNLAQLKDLVELVSQKQLRPPPIEYVALDEVNDALDRLRAGKVNGRGVIKFDEDKTMTTKGRL